MGGGAGLGGKDGCSDGGAVNWLGGRSCPYASLASVLVLLLSFCFGAACSKPNATALPDAKTVLQGIAAADPAKYPSLQETKHWSNPYLVVRTDRVGLLTGIAANEEQILKPEEVLSALAQLPGSAWPYGRAVAILVDEKPDAPEQDKVALRRNRGIVAGELQEAHVAINWIPTS
jgi:hypothetical protein